MGYREAILIDIVIQEHAQILNHKTKQNPTTFTATKLKGKYY